MYGKISKILLPFALLMLIGIWFWGYAAYQDKKRWQIKVENQYQRAFHDLSTNIEKLQQELGHMMLFSSKGKADYRKGLVNVWRYANVAKSNITHLPLGSLPIHDTEQFLANTARFSFQTSIRDLMKQPMTETEKQTLSHLFENAKQMNEKLRSIQTQAIANRLKWVEVEQLLDSQDQAQHVIIDGINHLNQHVGSYQNVDWGPHQVNLFHKNDTQWLLGEEVSTTEIKQKALQYFGLSKNTKVDIVENGKDDTGYGTYQVTIYPENASRDPIYMNFTKKGGQLTYFVHSREVFESRITAKRARDIAHEFLEEKGYTGLASIQFDVHHHIANIVFAKTEHDFVIFPQQLSVMVAMDNGEMIGIQASEYVFLNKNRSLVTMKLTMEEARQQLHDQFQIDRSRKVIVLNEIKQEIPCYEFTGKLFGKEHRVLINGLTGNVESVETIIPLDKTF